jgi:AsmA protein
MPAAPPAEATPPVPSVPSQSEATGQQDSQPMNEVLRQLFNR